MEIETLPKRAFRIILTLLASASAAALCIFLNTPIPWMMGPLIATAGLSICGLNTRSSVRLRNAAQWIVGSSLGMYFTEEVSKQVISLWWLIILTVVWSLLMGYLYGLWLYRNNQHQILDLDTRTAFFSSLIGGASEMTLLAEKVNARTDLVASAHSLRVLIVTVTVPLAIQLTGFHGSYLLASNPVDFNLSGLMLLLALTGIGALTMVKLGRSNAWFLGPLVVSIGLTSTNHIFSSLPVELTNLAQMVIGISLGVRFTSQFIHTAPRWLISVSVGTITMISVSALFSLALSKFLEIPYQSAFLGTAPGGIAEMAITAKVLQLGVAFVTALQACRVIAVLLLGEHLFNWLLGKGLMTTRDQNNSKF